MKLVALKESVPMFLALEYLFSNLNLNITLNLELILYFPAHIAIYIFYKTRNSFREKLASALRPKFVKNVFASINNN